MRHTPAARADCRRRGYLAAAAAYRQAAAASGDPRLAARATDLMAAGLPVTLGGQSGTIVYLSALG